MAPTQTVPSFDDIIKAGRERKINEQLAKKIFGNGRRSSAPTAGLQRKPGAGLSLASRVGITKPPHRSASSTPLARARFDPSTRGDSRALDNSQGHGAADPSDKPSHIATLGASQMSKTPSDARGISIKGLAGPYVVMGSNFAPGTTSVDIQSAMEPVGGEMQSCRIITASPTVLAEMVFVEKSGAESVIATFNNQKADGRILHIYMKQGSPSHVTSSPSTSTPARPVPISPQPSRPELVQAPATYDSHREHANGTRNNRRADPEYQDGSYGFDAAEQSMDVDMVDRHDERREEVRDDRRGYRNDSRIDNRRGNFRGDARRYGNGRGRDVRGLYSDELYPRPQGRGFH